MPYYLLDCTNCGFANNIVLQTCPECGFTYSNTINVRRALLPTEIQALQKRYDQAKEDLLNRNLSNEMSQVESEVLTKGKAVININLHFLWEWLMHGTAEYMSYRRLLLEGLRLKANFEDDVERSSVESFLFGSEIDIIYAALTLNESGLESYGKISVILDTKKIELRTCLMEKNSYIFVNEVIANGWHTSKPLPPGHFATWGNRHILAIAKSYSAISDSITSAEVVLLLLQSTNNRATDKFIELYINGQINKSAVEKIKIPLSLSTTFVDKQLLQYEELKSKYTVEEY